MSQPEPTDTRRPAAADAAGPASVRLPDSVAAGAINHAIFRVARLHRMLAGQLLRRVGLHPSQELVMMQLWDRGPQRQTDLVRLLGSDAATMTRTIQRLENAGFVRRRPSTTDKRATIVEPTAASLALRSEVEQVWLDLEASLTEHMTSAERTEAVAVLGRIEESLIRATSQDA
ncbi:MarR family winged helix-turn-helix transcriptional regulator [Streptomyces sp. MMG1121]|uniref:MarR family winged helix-turn-helix transcriptional regulator n=1 Tax=Streptomyces sp. MMG1121 TaxID=1415544 RepID=UPI0006AEB016|nr:MarR family winged helix-turn-helix transcriptional regulator [Streptomyces sp. MMG1121]KOV60454.1 transcriptional regulator [Streptomyces sp. MMG1121]